MSDKMIQMVRGRDFNLRSLSGHTVKFKKNVPTDVPPGAVQEAMKIGAFPVEDGDIKVDEEKTDMTPVEPVGAEREEILQAAMENMKVENNRGDFDATGLPTLKKLSARVKFTVSKAERDQAWELMTSDDE
jgi:hypothetical protein